MYTKNVHGSLRSSSMRLLTLYLSVAALVGSFRLFEASKLRAWQTTKIAGNVPPVGASVGVAPLGRRLFVYSGSTSVAHNDLAVFDTFTFTWTLLEKTVNGGSPTGRSDFGMTFHDIRLYIFGGSIQGDSWTNELHIFDAGKLAWTDVSDSVSGDVPERRSKPGFASCAGMLLLFGGIGSKSGEDFLNDFYRLETDTLTWQDLSAAVSGLPPKPKNAFGMACLANKLYVHGGSTHQGYSNELHVFDPAAMTWTDLSTSVVGTVPTKRANLGMAAVGPKLFVFGGTAQDPDQQSTYPLQTLQVFDTESMEWEDLNHTLDFAPSARRFPGVSAVGDRVYVFGGTTSDNLDNNDLYAFNATSLSWADMNGPVGGAPPTNREGLGMVAADGRVFLFGGSVNAGYANDLHVLNPGGMTWVDVTASVSGEPPAARCCVGMAEAHGRVYVFGGRNNAGWFNDLHALDPSLMSWTDLTASVSGRAPPKRESMGIARSGDRVYVFGGKQGPTWFNDLHAFSPTDLTWTDLSASVSGAPPAPRATLGLAACGHNVYVFSGTLSSVASGGYPGRVADLHVLDTTSKRWTDISEPLSGTLPDSRNSMGLECWADTLYVVGGENGLTWFNDVHAFDTRSRAWTDLSAATSAAPLVGRERFGSAVLDGVIYVFGGRGDTGLLADLQLFRVPAIVELSPFFAQDIPFIDDTDTVTVPAGHPSVLDRHIPLCVGAFPCRLNIASAGGTLVFLPGGGLSCDEFEGCSLLSLDSLVMQCDGQSETAPVSISSGAKLQMVSSTVSGCSSQTSGGFLVLSRRSSASISQSEFANCSSAESGGLIFADGAEIEITGSTFDQCAASNHGGVVVTNAALRVASSTFRRCQAGGQGGAIASIFGAHTDVTASVFLTCHSASGGGAVQSLGELGVTASVFEECWSGGAGGAIFADQSNEFFAPSPAVLSLVESSFSRCNSSSDGGVVSLKRGKLDVSSSIFSSNFAGGGGGGIRVSSGDAVVSDVAFQGNTAVGHGGAMTISDGTASIHSAQFVDNTAEGGGGGAVHASSASVRLRGIEALGNTAVAGGGGVLLWEGEPAPTIESWYCGQCGASCPAGTVCTASGNASGEEGHFCLSCPAGTHKPLPGYGWCAACPDGTFSGPGASACSSCPRDSILSPSSGNASDCVCNAGYESDPDGGCIACGAGTFKAAPGSEPCVRCPAGTFKLHSGAGECSACPEGTYLNSSDDEGSACVACPLGSWSPAQSSDPKNCSCTAGFSGPDGGSCEACPAGTFKTVSGSDLCTDCPKGLFAVHGGTVCSACPLGSFAPVPQSSTCVECTRFAQVASVSEVVRGSCVSRNTPGPSCETILTIPPTVAVPDAVITIRVEQTDYDQALEAISAIRVGGNPIPFNSLEANGEFNTCGIFTTVVDRIPIQLESSDLAVEIDTTVYVNLGDCDGVHLNAEIELVVWTAAQHSDGPMCVCNAGYESDPDGGCIACGAGTFKAAPGSEPCVRCPAGTFKLHSGAGECSACPEGTYLNSSGPPTFTSWLEVDQSPFTRPDAPHSLSSDHSLLVQFSGGGVDAGEGMLAFFWPRPSAHGHAATSVGVITSWSGVITDGPAPYEHDSEYIWVVAPTGASEVNLVFEHLNIKTYHSLAVERCFDLECSSAQPLGESPFAGAASPGLLHSDSGILRLVLRTMGGTTLSGFRAVFSADSTDCDKRVVTEPFGILRVAPPGGQACEWELRKPIGTELELRFLQINSFVGGGAVRVLRESGACMACPAGSTSPPQSVLLSNCSCSAGYTGRSADDCTPCPAGTFKTTAGSSPCQRCLVGSFSDTTGATACAACPAGTFHNTSQPGATSVTDCTACPHQTMSPAGSVEETACSQDLFVQQHLGACAGQCSCQISRTTEGVLSDGSGGADYSSRSKCWWLIAPPGAMSIDLSFSEVDIEVGWDHVRVYECLDLLCDGAPATEIVDATSLQTNVGILKVEFTSDGWVNAGGFQATWTAREVCGIGFHRPSQELPCQPCPTTQIPPNAMRTPGGCDTWQCNAGFFVSGPTCVPCPVNSTTAPGAVSIAECDCLPGYAGPGSGDCTACVAGKAGDSEGCWDCPPGTFKPTPGAGSCETCPPWMYAAGGASSCLECPENSGAPAQAVFREIALEGFAPVVFAQFGTSEHFVEATRLVLMQSDDENPTEGCGTVLNADELKGNIALIRRGSCGFAHKCLRAEEAGAVACVVANNQDGMVSMTGSGVAVPSVSISQADGDALERLLVSEQVRGSLAIPATNCSCSAATHSCAPLQDIGAGLPAVLVQSIRGDWAVQFELVGGGVVCQGGELFLRTEIITNATAWSRAASHAQCSCNAGYEGLACSGCPPGSYKDSQGTSECLQCPPGTAAEGAWATACMVCPPGTSALTGSTACSACGTHSHAPAQSEMCSCNAGYTAADGGGNCTACEAGTYKSSSGSAPCVACPDNSISPPSSASRGHCTCNRGFRSSPAGHCEECNATNGDCGVNSAMYGPCLASDFRALEARGPAIAFAGEEMQVHVVKRDFYAQPVRSDSSSVIEVRDSAASAGLQAQILGSTFVGLHHGAATLSFAVRPVFERLDAQTGTTELLAVPRLVFRGADTEALSAREMRSPHLRVPLALGLGVCKPGYVLQLEGPPSETGVRGGCSRCAAGSYALNPLLGGDDNASTPACLQCPLGLDCRGGADVRIRGGQWEAVEGRLRLLKCPRGHELRNSTHNLQECHLCEQGWFVAASDDPNARCQRCPRGFSCLAGGPPSVNAVVRGRLVLQARESMLAMTNEAFVALLVEVLREIVGGDDTVVTVAQRCGLMDACVPLNTEGGTRRAGGQAHFDVAMVSDSVGSAQLHSILTSSILASSVANHLDQRGVQVSEVVVDAEEETNDASRSPGNFTLQGGVLAVVGCERGFLLVNSSTFEQGCYQCEVGSYSFDFLDGCVLSGPAPVCSQRDCSACPSGATCGPDAFVPVVTGSGWELERWVDESLGVAHSVMRLVLCPPGWVLVRDQMRPLHDECIPCPAGTYSVVNATWTPAVMTVSSASQVPAMCEECEVGLVCDGDARVTARDDYWVLPHQGHERKVAVYECPKGACREGGSCVEGRDPDSPVCGICEEGWALLGSDCTRCSGSASTGLKAAVMTLLVVVFLVAWWILTWQPFFQLAPKPVDTRDVTELPLLERVKANLRVFARTRGKTVSAYAKIFISFWQIVSTFESTYRIEWPQAAERVWGFGAALSLNLFDIPGPHCFKQTLSHLQVLQFVTGVPLIVCFLLYVPTLALHLRGEHARNPWRMKNTSDHFWHAMLFWLFVIYPYVSITAVAGFKCREIGQRWLLASDLREECPWTHPASAPFVWTVVASLLYPLGIPLFMFWQLRRQRIPELAAKKHEDAILQEMLLQYTRLMAGSVERELALHIGGGQSHRDERLITSRIQSMYDEVSERGAKPVTQERLAQYLRSIGIAAFDDDHKSNTLEKMRVAEDGIIHHEVFVKSLMEIVSKENHIMAMNKIDDVKDDVLAGLCSFRWELLSRRTTASDSMHLQRRHRSSDNGLISSFAYAPADVGAGGVSGRGSAGRGEALCAEGRHATTAMSGTSGLQRHAASVLLGSDAGREEMLDFLAYRGERLLGSGAISIPSICWEGASREEADAIERVGFLFENYKVQHYYHELLEVARKFVMTGCMIFLWPGSPEQLAVAVVVTVTALMHLLKTQPFANARIGSLQAAMLAAQAAMVLYGLLLAVDGMRQDLQRENMYSKAASAVLLILLTTVIFFVPPLTLIFDNRRELQKYLAPSTLRKHKKGPSHAQSAATPDQGDAAHASTAAAVQVERGEENSRGLGESWTGPEPAMRMARRVEEVTVSDSQRAHTVQAAGEDAAGAIALALSVSPHSVLAQDIAVAVQIEGLQEWNTEGDAQLDPGLFVT